jgi:hypothetical protein
VAELHEQNWSKSRNRIVWTSTLHENKIMSYGEFDGEFDGEFYGLECRGKSGPVGNGTPQGC